VTWPRILAGTALAAIMLTVGLLIGAAETLSALGLGALVVGMVLIAEGYFLIWKVQLIHGLAEQTLGSAARLLALVPGKTAPRTDGGKLKPHTWWERLPVEDELEIDGEPNFVVDPEPQTAPIPALPVTQPDLKAAATVGPLPVSYADWRKDWDARIAKDIAEIRGVK
jgi:hypothetical protein